MPDVNSEDFRGDAKNDRSDRVQAYRRLLERIDSLLEGEDDWVAAMATVVCELHNGFEHYDWTGFYRVVEPALLAIGPYQGSHGCLRIPFERGVCGRAARTKQTQLVDDVRQVPDHIACSASTRSEIVVPLVATGGEVFAVLDVDSDEVAAFSEVDRQHLEDLCQRLGERFG